jgi:hypothetical protein
MLSGLEVILVVSPSLIQIEGAFAVRGLLEVRLTTHALASMVVDAERQVFHLSLLLKVFWLSAYLAAGLVARSLRRRRHSLSKLKKLDVMF